MGWFTLRPTFTVPLSESQQTAVEKLQLAYSLRQKDGRIMVYGEYGEVHLPSAVHRFWTPYLAFSIDRDGQRSILHGRFAPRIEIWTVVWIFYLVFAFSAFFGFILGFSQFMIGQIAWGSWVGIAALLLWLGLIALAETGQRWSADQMQLLRQQLDELITSAQIQH
jgi:TM2 domain-containing membrane protein YozV